MTTDTFTRRPDILTLGEIAEQGLTLTDAQESLVESGLNLVGCYLRQRDLPRAAQAFRSLMLELRGDLENAASSDGEAGVSSLGISVREINYLQRRGVDTVEELREKLATAAGRRWIMAIPNVGPQTLLHYFEALREWDQRRRQA